MLRTHCKQCPDLQVLPYDFEAYEQVSLTLYRILFRYSALVQVRLYSTMRVPITCLTSHQPLSCDEALLDLTGAEDPEAVISEIRREIFDATQCPASAGICCAFVFLAFPLFYSTAIFSQSLVDSELHSDCSPCHEKG